MSICYMCSDLHQTVCLETTIEALEIPYTMGRQMLLNIDIVYVPFQIAIIAAKIIAVRFPDMLYEVIGNEKFHAI